VFAGLTLAGCETFRTPRYGLSADNIVALRNIGNVAGPRVAVGDFAEPPKFNPDCLAGRIAAADGLGFAAYIRKALVDEFKIAGLYADGAAIVLTGMLDQLDFNSTVGSWDMTLTVRSSNGRWVRVQENYRFPGSIVAATACQRAADAFYPAVQNLLQKLITSPDFRGLFHG
jgi:hypothetical protein